MAGLTIAGDTASALYGTGQTICLGYHVTDMGVFLGMILGVVVALVHNRFIDTEFEGAMAMYGNSKFVFVVSAAHRSGHGGGCQLRLACGQRRVSTP